jgi:hypothetical protein
MLAYLDPGSGSMVLSALVGGIAGIAVFFKMVGHKLMFWKKTPKKDELETAEAKASESTEATSKA